MNAIVKRDILSILMDDNIPWQSFNGASVLVTGATGLIGSLFVHTLLAREKMHPTETIIYILLRDEQKGRRCFGEDYKRLTPVLGDVRDPIYINGSIDYIVHCASVTTSKLMVTDPIGTISTSVDGTRNILTLAIAKHVKSVLYLSSMEVYGVTSEKQNPVTEEKLGFIDLTNARSSYPESKRLCELICHSYAQQFGLPVKIARLAQTFGPGVNLTDNRLAVQLARSVVSGADIVLHTEGRSVMNICYTTDTLRGIFTLLTKGENGEVYNICNDAETRTVYEIAKLVAEQVAEEKIRVTYDIPETNSYGFAPDSIMHLSSNKLRSLGWQPYIGLEEAYRRLVVYLQTEK